MTLIFAGYLPKQIASRDDWLKAPAFREIWSVSECQSKRPLGWVDHWRHNDLGLFDTVPLAESVVPADQRHEFTVVAYRFWDRQWRSEPCTATSKTEAKDLAIDVERRCERQRRGLEPTPPRNGGGSLGDLFRWWLETYAQPRTSYVRDAYTVTKHFLSAPIARLRLTEITPGVARTRPRMPFAGRCRNVSRTSCGSTRCRGCSPPWTIAGGRSSRRPSTPGQVPRTNSRS